MYPTSRPLNSMSLLFSPAAPQMFMGRLVGIVFVFFRCRIAPKRTQLFSQT